MPKVHIAYNKLIMKSGGSKSVRIRTYLYGHGRDLDFRLYCSI